MTDTDANALYVTQPSKNSTGTLLNRSMNSTSPAERHHQLPGESVDAFFTVLKNNVKKCNHTFMVEDCLVYWIRTSPTSSAVSRSSLFKRR
ncbi:hypothetical protein MRX96_054904 [Rhipicephalus microplus]